MEVSSLLPDLNLNRVMSRVATDNQGLSTVELAECEREYRRFLWLIKEHPGVSISPNQRADTVWHAHILFTRQYRQDCNSILGRFVDHEPFDATTPKAIILKSARITNELYAKHFGEPNRIADCDSQACMVSNPCNSGCQTEGLLADSSCSGGSNCAGPSCGMDPPPSVIVRA